MKRLLIIGAGEHGRVVEEVAEACGFQTDFLDDHNPKAVGRLTELELFQDYDNYFIALGDNCMRRNISLQVNKLTTLIHPKAYVSPSASIGVGTVVLPGAVVNSRSKIGKCCILSIGVLVDHDVIIEDYCHINTGAIVRAGKEVKSLMKIDAGTIV